MIPRWTAIHKVANRDNEILTTIKIYKIGETEHTVRQDFKDKLHKRELIRCTTT